MEPEDEVPRLREQLRAQQAENQALQRENARLRAEHPHEDAEREKVAELLHDLQVHQSELQAQNEELRSIQEELSIARDRYSDLYDFAPVGYLTLDAESRLLEANFTFAGLLGGIERQNLLHQPLAQFIARESQDEFHFFWLRLQRSVELETVELQVIKADDTTFWARFDAIAVQKTTSGDVQGTREYRLTVSDISERKQAEKALRESEELFRLLVEGVEDYAIFLLNVEGRIISWNAGAERMKGYRREEILGRSVAVFYLPEDVADGRPMQELYLAAQAGRYEVESWRVRKDGSQFLADILTTTLYNPDGSVRGYSKITRDITASKQAEAERERLLVEVQRRILELDTIFNAIVDPMIAYNAEGIVMKANPAMVLTLGRDPAGMSVAEVAQALAMRRPDGTLMHEMEIPALRALHGEAVKGERLLVTDVNGQEMILQITAALLIQDDKPWGVVSIWHDITKRERAFEEATRRAAELDATISGIADALVIYNPEGEVVRMNEAAQALMRFSEEECRETLAERWAHRRFTTPDGKPFALENLPVYRALQGERVQGVVMVVGYPSEARVVWVSASAGPILTPDHRLLGAVANYADITPQHNLQEQQKALLQMVSHDLRAPLTVIKGHAQVVASLLEENNIDGKLQQCSVAIDRGVNRMDAMIQDLVDVVRWEGGQLELMREPVELPPYFDDLLRRMSPAMETSRIQVAMPAGLPPVFADYARLERIMVNLLSNALKYSNPGTPVLLRARQQDGEVMVSVSDQGQGIAAEEIPRLFTRFYRAKGRKAEGIGLGLYITRVLVEAQGGRVWVESEVGKGSTFYFTLPVVQADE